MSSSYNDGDTSGDETEVSFREAEDYVEQRRQKEIMDAVQFVNETNAETKGEYERGQIRLDTRRAIVRNSVERLIRETEQLMEKAGAEQLLEGTTLGTVTIQPPAELIQYINQDDVHVLGDGSVEPKIAATIDGVRGFMRAPTTFTAQWTVRADVPHKGPKPVTSSASTRMPIQISMVAFQQIKAFLGATNLALDPKLEDYDGGEVPGI